MEQQLQQLIDLTEKGLTQMATQMGVSLPQLWEILIRQQYIEAVQSFVWLGILLIAIIIGYKKRKYLIKLELFDTDTPLCILGFFGLVFFSIMLIITINNATIGIGQILNAEYYAIQDITEFIGNLTNKQ